MVIFLSASVEGILHSFTNFYLQRKSLIFLRKNRDCKVVDPKRRILEASPHARIQCQVGIIKKVEQIQCLSCYRILLITATAVAWWRQWQLGNAGGGGAGGGGVVAVAVVAAWW
jgi:hypothetical protein